MTTKQFALLQTLALLPTAFGQSAQRQLPALTAVIATSTVGAGSGSQAMGSESVVFTRDEHGRTRREGGGKIEIDDPVARTVTVLDPAAGTFRRVRLAASAAPTSAAKAPRPTAAGPGGPRLAGPKLLSLVDLGQDVVAGFAARGTRRTVQFPPGSMGSIRFVTQTTESWQSNELGLVLLRKTTDTKGHSSVEAFQDIKINIAVDKTQFGVPAWYRPAD